MSDTEQANASSSEPTVTHIKPLELSDNDWSFEKCIDEVQRNLASVEQMVTNQNGQKLIIRKYQSQCRKLARWIPIARPTPEYLIYIQTLSLRSDRH